MAKPSRGSLFRQRGAIGFMGLLTMLLAVAFTALAVDSGRLWMQQRKLQTIADIASIQAARQLGCSTTIADVKAAAQAAAVNNGYTGQLGQAPNIVELGNVDTIGGLRKFTAGAGQEAVHVKATQSVPTSLVAGGMFGGNVVLNAEAVSISDPPLAAFSAGTFAVRFNTQNSTLLNEDTGLLNGMLGGILGSSLSLDVLSYKGIAATQVSLLDLLKASGQVGGVDSLLNTNMQLGQLLGLIASAGSQNGTANAQATAAMQTLVSAAVSNASIRLSDVLAVTSPDKEAAAKVGLNALSLVTTSALIANGAHAITLPLAVNVPGITSINALVTVINPPKVALGPAAGTNGVMCTTVETAQVSAKVAVLVNLALVKLDLALNLTVAQGSAGLRSISDNGGQADVKIDASPGLASVTLTNSAGTLGSKAKLSTIAIPPLIPSIPIADISLNLSLQSPAQTLDFLVSHPISSNLPQMQTVSSSLGDSLENMLKKPSAISVTVLSAINLGLVNSTVSTVISPLLGEIGRVLLDPLLEMLGIQVGGMDVTLEGLQFRQTKPLVI